MLDQSAYSMPKASSVRHASFTSGPLRVTLALSPQGRILSKRESVAGCIHEWSYAYDDQGRLARAALNGKTVEAYAYGPHGKRLLDTVAALGMAGRELRYDRNGQLVLAGRTRYRYDRSGRLAVMKRGASGTHLVYGENGGLEAVHLANGLVLEYATDGMGRPLEKILDGRVAERFHWRQNGLGFWEDLDQKRFLKFVYGQGRVPTAARLEQDGRTVDLVLGADQIGTVKAIATSDGYLIQHIAYDSFGNVLELRGEELGLPIGFAGGVRDRHLGLIRFGHRDYDPTIGRFTAPDPLGDTGGDHDLWEYCVDDPVNAVDPKGLQEQPATDEDPSSNGFWDEAKDFLTPPLLAQEGNPKREWAEGMIKRPLHEFKDGFVKQIPTLEVEAVKIGGRLYKKHKQQGK